MSTIRLALTVVLSVLLTTLVGGCAGPEYFSQPLSSVASATPDRTLLGVWSRKDKDGVQTTLAIYPRGSRSYLVETVCFGAKQQQIGCGLVKAWLTTVGAHQYLSCQVYMPNLIDQQDNIATLKKDLKAGTDGQKRFTESLIASARRTGLAHVYFVVRVDSITPDKLVVTPYINHHLSKTISVAGQAMDSPRALAKFISSLAGAKLAAKKPWVFNRISSAQALPEGFYMGY